MIEIKDKTKCNGCFGCKQICPTNAITMVADNEGFLYPNVNTDKCINCDLCVKICPEISPAAISEDTNVYAAYRNDFDKRLQSASGGIFAVIAEEVILDGGYVFGAVFDKDFKVFHAEATTFDELKPMLGSKYVQSEIGDSFSKAKSFLDQGKKVLFSGTPCQISGLKKYLNKNYDNLITIDLVCHGVPSPLIWNSYLKEFCSDSQLVKFTQRSKDNGVSKSTLKFEFSNGKIIEEGYTKNMFMRGFSQNLFLRPSCYDCSFKGIERCSDITIGDFWGLESSHPEFFNDYGVSLVMVHSKNGQDAIDKIFGKIEIITCTDKEAIAENPCIIEPVIKNENREKFFNNLDNGNVVQMIKKYTKRPDKRQLFWKIRDAIVHPLWVIKNKLFRGTNEQN